MATNYRILYGSVALIFATVLWGSSFVFIKFSVENISGLSYTFYRMFLATAILTPIALFRKLRKIFDYRSFVNGIVTGIAYMFGLLLQGIGTSYTLPSTSAFITGLNTVHVHIYCALIRKSYSFPLLVSLILAIAGLHMVTAPSGGIGVGEVLVFCGSIAWAAQILLISRYSRDVKSYTEFLYGMFIPSLIVAPYALLHDNPTRIYLNVWIYTAYLALMCSIIASLLQVIGQHYVNPAVAALIYLLEPLFALLFSILLYGEEVDVARISGGMMIVLASYIALKHESNSNN